MAVSIAKLSIILSTETSQMSAGLKRAQTSLQRFQTDTTRAGDGGAKSFALMTAGLSHLSSSLRIAERHLIDFTAAGAKLQTQIARIAGGKDSLGALDTQLAKLQRQKAIQGSGLADVAAGGLKLLLKAADSVRKSLGNQPIKSVDAFIERSIAWSDKARANMERMREVAKQLAEDNAKNEEAIKRQGQAVTDSLRNPMEVLSDDVTRLNTLFRHAAINATTFDRGIQRAADEFEIATKAAQEFKSASRGPFPALEMGTQGAISATHASARLAEEKKIVELEARHLAVTERIEAILRDKKEVRFAIGRLP